MESHLIPEILIFASAWMNDTLENTTHARIHMWCF